MGCTIGSADGFNRNAEKVMDSVHHFGGQLEVENWYHQVFDISGSTEYTLCGTRGRAAFGHTDNHNKPKRCPSLRNRMDGAIF